jgi:hypothetical protein
MSSPGVRTSLDVGPGGSPGPPAAAVAAAAAGVSRQVIILYAIIGASAFTLLVLIVILVVTVRRRRRRRELLEASQISFGPPVGRKGSWWVEVNRSGLNSLSTSMANDGDATLGPGRSGDAFSGLEKSGSMRLPPVRSTFGREVLRKNSTLGRRASLLRSSFAGSAPLSSVMIHAKDEATHLGNGNAVDGPALAAVEPPLPPPRPPRNTAFPSVRSFTPSFPVSPKG